MSLFSNKLIIKGLLGMIDDYLPLLDKAISEYRKEIIAKTELNEGEDITCMIFSVEEKTYISILIITADNVIRSQIETSLFSDFIKKIVTLFKSNKDAID